MIDKLFGSKSAEDVLLFLTAFEEGYARKIALFYGTSLNVIQKRLAKLEDAGVLVSTMKGRTKLYVWNPRYPFLKEFQAFLKKVFLYLPEETAEKYRQQRRRPRKGDKKL